MVDAILYGASIGISSGVIGWFLRGWWLFRNTIPLYTPIATYEVRSAITTKDGPVVRVLYTGDDLQKAKTVFKTDNAPKSSLIELYTRSYHTASRRV